MTLKGGGTDAGQIEPQRHANDTHAQGTDTSVSDLFKGEVTSIRTPNDTQMTRFDTQKTMFGLSRVGANQMWQLSRFDTGSSSISTESQLLSSQKGHKRIKGALRPPTLP